MFKNQMLNIVISAKSKEDEAIAKELKELISKSLNSIFTDDSLTVIEVSADNYLNDLKNAVVKKTKDFLITLAVDCSNIVKVGSHSNRFHSLEIAEKNSFKQVTNVQYNIDSIPQVLSFSTVNSEVATMVSTALNNLHYEFINQQMTMEV